MNRTKARFAVDIALILVFFLSVSTGLLKFPDLLSIVEIIHHISKGITGSGQDGLKRQIQKLIRLMIITTPFVRGSSCCY